MGQEALSRTTFWVENCILIKSLKGHADVARPWEAGLVTFVVTSNCHRCRFTDCAVVCPVDAFHGDPQMLYIDPEECIDCGVCVGECPVGAIFADIDVPQHEARWLDINRERARKLPVVNELQPELAGARQRAREVGFELP